MNISRNSWHYRMADFMLDFFGKSPSNSLCIYFWQVVLSPFLIVAGVAILLFALTAILFVFLYGFGAFFNDMLASMKILPAIFHQLPGVFNYRAVVTSVIIDTLLVLVIAYNTYFKHRWVSNKSDEPKETNFVFAYVKAKKQKICPFINFKD